MEIITIPIDKLTPDPNNAKDHPKWQIDQIKNSIEQFGNLDPIGVWGENNLIVEGHGRYEALKSLGYNEADCIRLDSLTEEERIAYALAHNKLTMNSGFIPEALDMNLDAIGEIDMSLFGFDIPDNKEEADITEDEVPEEVETRCKPGDIWLLGQHRLMCGDSTEIDAVEKLMDGSRADMLLTDPPYNVDYTGKTKDSLKIKNDKMDNESFRQFLRDAFSCADMVMRAGAVFYIWHADSESYNFRGACVDNNWKVRECLIWVKNSMVLGRQDYQWKHEPCLYGWKDGASHLWASDRKQTTVLNFDRPTRSDLHPTMKPIGLMAYQISNNTHEGDLVLDLFGGSGSTLIACEQLNRKCCSMELDPHYCDVIIQRWENFTGKNAVIARGDHHDAG